MRRRQRLRPLIAAEGRQSLDAEQGQQTVDGGAGIKIQGVDPAHRRLADQREQT